MPLYTYEDPETGIKIDLRRSVEDRNKPIVLKRMKDIPDRVGVMIPGATQDGSFNDRMIRSHYQKEQAEGSRFKSSYTKEQIKQAWATQ
jgi:predicted nucleic acid-binding Zn ribbon protein